PMAMVQPSAGFSRNPGHLERLPDFHGMRKLQRPLSRLIDFVMLSVTFSVELKVETVQVHRMTQVGGIDQAPMDALAYGIGEPFRVRPGLAVDRCPRRP